MSASANPQTLIQSWNVPELQKRLKFVLYALLIFVFCTHIPAPGIDMTLVRNFFQSAAGSGGIFNLIDLFSGGALKQFSILALGIMPYINASIMMQLMTAVDPKLKEIQQEGEEGRKKISKWTRYLALGLAFFQGAGMMVMFYGSPQELLTLPTMTALFSVAAGTCFLMWLGDEISQKGVGNGVSLIITLGIVASIPGAIWSELSAAQLQNQRMVALLLLLVFAVIVTTAIVFVQLSVRRIPVQYARRQIGRKIYGGQSTFLPIKLTQAGVIPIIFAISVLMVPQTLFQLLPRSWDWVAQGNAFISNFQNSGWYLIVQFLLVYIFTFVYTAVTFNTQDIAENLKKNNGFIPGVRPGRQTFEFLDKVLHRVTVFGATFLGLVAILPVVINMVVQTMTNVTINSFWIGGTSLLIVVGVALDTVQQMQAHMIMRHYSGFGK
ncbi:preprotein translocase subunit SecY [bacterium]|nr:preprotein translocase subunit SecY [bacterium]